MQVGSTQLPWASQKASLRCERFLHIYRGTDIGAVLCALDFRAGWLPYSSYFPYLLGGAPDSP